MTTVVTLLETAVIADLSLVADLLALVPKPRDHDGKLAGDDEPGDDEATITLVVTASDTGEFYPGSGIRKLKLEILVNANAVAGDVTAARLDDLAGKIDDRIPVQIHAGSAAGPVLAPVVERLSNSSIKVFGVMAGDPSPRTEEALIRTRHIVRTVIAAQLA
jgi:hypothetical protein